MVLILVVQDVVRSKLKSMDGGGNSDEVAGVDKFVLELVLTNAVEISSDDVTNGRVDDDDDL
jgi:hypothetical protein